MRSATESLLMSRSVVRMASVSRAPDGRNTRVVDIALLTGIGLTTPVLLTVCA